MRSITAVYTISPVSVLMVGCNGLLHTSPCCLHLCMCTLVLPRVYVLGGLSGILRRFYLSCRSCLAVCLAIWCSVLSGYMSSMFAKYINSG